MPHTQGTSRRLARHREGLRKQPLEVLPALEALTELDGLCGHLLVGQRLEVALEVVHLGDNRLVGAKLLALTECEELLQDVHAR